MSSMNNNIRPSTPDVSRTNVYSIVSIIFALPLPILITILWMTIAEIKGQANVVSSQTMNAIVLYAVQFFIIPLSSAGSISVALRVIVVSLKYNDSLVIARRLAIASLTVTVIGCILLALFLRSN